MLTREVYHVLRVSLSIMAAVCILWMLPIVNVSYCGRVLFLISLIVYVFNCGCLNNNFVIALDTIITTNIIAVNV